MDTYGGKQDLPSNIDSPKENILLAPSNYTQLLEQIRTSQKTLRDDITKNAAKERLVNMFPGFADLKYQNEVLKVTHKHSEVRNTSNIDKEFGFQLIPSKQILLGSVVLRLHLKL